MLRVSRRCNRTHDRLNLTERRCINTLLNTFPAVQFPSFFLSYPFICLAFKTASEYKTSLTRNGVAETRKRTGWQISFEFVVARSFEKKKNLGSKERGRSVEGTEMNGPNVERRLKFAYCATLLYKHRVHVAARISIIIDAATVAALSRNYPLCNAACSSRAISPQ